MPVFCEAETTILETALTSLRPPLVEWRYAVPANQIEVSVCGFNVLPLAKRSIIIILLGLVEE